MKLAKVILAGATLTVFSAAALAQQASTGLVTTINRIAGTVGIEQTPSGTVGADGGRAAEEFKVQSTGLLDTVHAGDRVTFSVTNTNGSKTITRIERQK